MKLNSGITIFWILLFMSGCNSPGTNGQNDYVIPGLMKTGENGVISQELIYPLDNRPTPQCHATSIEETDGGVYRPQRRT